MKSPVDACVKGGGSVEGGRVGTGGGETGGTAGVGMLMVGTATVAAAGGGLTTDGPAGTSGADTRTGEGGAAAAARRCRAAD
ncbi:MAG TPA: hypothetical protein VLH41_10055, partial [Thermoanaerobaculia bacterium]|nr:hypothetical protein [Thermoanaerobaculia bacterium]